jgi:hypothetical protein
MRIALDYGAPSAFVQTRESATLGFSADRHRPLRFVGRVHPDRVMPVRIAMRALSGVIWSDDTWMSEEDFRALVLDPVVTVHPDRVFFEGFSQDSSAYGLVIADRSAFRTEGQVGHGTTNVDFTHWLATAIDQMRSSRVTTFKVEPAGFEVATAGTGGRTEARVDLPDPWLRGFLQLQAAMALPGTRLRVRPVDLLAAVRYLAHTKAKVSPRGVRWVLSPDRDARLVLEPWEKEIPLKGSDPGVTVERVIRTWGRRRWKLLEPLLPYADAVDVYLKGRALPYFFVVHLPGGVRFVLGLSGWTANSWTGGGFDLLTSDEGVADDVLDRVISVLRDVFVLPVDEIALRAGLDKPTASRALSRLCRSGRVIYDVEARAYRHRELFAVPLAYDAVFPPDPRRDEAKGHVESGRVRISGVQLRETTKTKKLKTPDGPVVRDVVYRDRVVSGEIAGETAQVVTNDEDRILFGTCTCAFFKENLLNRGPCAHLVALLLADRAQRVELPTSAQGVDLAPAPPPPEEEPEEELDEEEDDGTV